jgi:ribosomal protein L10
LPFPKEKKAELVARYVDLLKNSQGIIVTEHRGMKMANFDALRAKMRELGSTYMVVSGPDQRAGGGGIRPQ